MKMTLLVQNVISLWNKVDDNYLVSFNSDSNLDEYI